MAKWLFLLFIVISCNAYSQGEHLERMTTSELDQRYLYIQNRLDNTYHYSAWWQHGWEGYYGASSLVQAGLAISADNADDEIRFGVGAFKSAIAFSAMVMNPLPITDGDEALDVSNDSVSNTETRAHKIQRLKRAEAVFKRRSERATSIHTWARHGSAVLFNLATAGIVSVYGDDKDALASALGGILISEINIWTQPSQGAQDWNDYQNLKSSDRLSWKLLPIPNGILVSLDF